MLAQPPHAAGRPSQDAGRMAYDEPLASRGWTPFLPPPEGQSVDLRGHMPPRSSGEALPAGRKVPPAGLAALPAAPPWKSGERRRGEVTPGDGRCVCRSVARLPVVPPDSAGRQGRHPFGRPLLSSGPCLQGARRPMAPSVAGGPCPHAEQPTGSPPPSSLHGGLQQRGRVLKSKKQSLQGGRAPLDPPRGPAGSPRDVFPALDTPCGGPPPCSRPVNRPCRCQRGPYGGSNDVVGALRGVDRALYTPAGALQGGNPPRGGPTGGRSRGCHPPGGADPLQNTPVGALGGVDRRVGGPTGGRSAP